MIAAAKYARENNIPYLGLCLGMQVAIIEYARHVCMFHDAHSIELDPNTTHPVIALMPDQNGIEDIGGTLRLGSYPCVLDKTSKAYQVYGTENISERHRHRYEVNNDYRTALTEHGMKLCGTSPDGRIVEMIEIPEHPWFIATQAHPELKSRPNRPHPLFHGFIEAANKVNRYFSLYLIQYLESAVDFDRTFSYNKVKLHTLYIVRRRFHIQYIPWKIRGL